MARPVALLACVLTLTALAGCTATPAPTATPTPTATGTASATDPCPAATADATVPGWTKHGGAWASVPSAAGRPDVVCGKATKALSSLVRDEGSFTDLEANVSFNMQDGDSGAGLVLHYRDEQNFNIVRYSPREQGWHLFNVVAGNRQKQDEGSVTPPTTNPELGQWVSLRVTSTDGRVEAWDGATKVIDYTLRPEASHAGRVGYFLRDTGMAAYFDGFQVAAR